ncbi:MAG: ArnT family glycosyltransferase, partial [Acidithiobacillales bacterium]
CAVFGRTRSLKARCVLSAALGLLFVAVLLLSAGHAGWAGLTAAAAGIGLLKALPTDRLGGDPSLAWMALPLLAGALLRFYALAQVPAGYSEHAVVHHVAITLPLYQKLGAARAAGDVAGWLRAASETVLNDQFGFDALVSSLGFHFFGVGPTPSRLTCALLGTLTILVAWRVGSLAGGRRLGLIFAFLLALSPWHVSISRYGDAEHVLSPLQLLLVLAFYLEARTSCSLLSMVGGGALLATGWLIYASNQVTPLIVFLLVLVSAVLEPARFRRDAWRWAAGVAAFVLLSWAPLATFAHSGSFLPNLRTGYASEGAALWDAGKRMGILGGTARELFVQGTDPWFSRPGGSLGFLEAALLVPGLFLSIASCRRGAYSEGSRIVLVSLPLTLLPGLFAPDVSFRRLFLLAVIVLFLASLVLTRIVDGLLGNGFPSPLLKGCGAVAAALLVVLAAHIYFERVRAEAEEGSRLQEAVAERVRRSLGESDVCIALFPGQTPDDYNAFIRFVGYEDLERLQAEGLRPSESWGFWSCSNPGTGPSFPHDGKARCLLVPQELVSEPQRCSGLRIPDQIREWLPGATMETTAGRRGDLLFTTWCAPAAPP